MGKPFYSFLRNFIICLLGMLVMQIGEVEGASKKYHKPEKQPPIEKTEFGKAMTFSVLRLSSSVCEPLCPEWIAAEGEITDRTPDKLAKLLAKPEYRKLPVVLNSGGGKVIAAMKMGRLIHKYGMTTVVAGSYGKDCSIGNTCTTMGTPADKIHLGFVLGSANCDSACTLILQGGVVRIAGEYVNIGLHQPHDTAQRWVDHYWDTWRIINGKKHIISHRFLKRTYNKPVYIAGVVPEMRTKYIAYFKEMGGSLEILDEMNKASPTAINNISYNTGRRAQLGLVTDNSLDVRIVISDYHCKTFGKLSINCVYLKPDTAVAISKPQTEAPCFLLGGCEKP